MQLPLHGLYAITDNSLVASRRFEVIEQAMIGGAKILQYRDKNRDKELRKTQAKALRNLCYKYKIPFIINDDLKLAQQVNADGVHLGKDDPDIATARAVLGDDAIIGISCYNQLSLAQQAVEAGATYVAFGRFFRSHTKPQAVSCSIDVLREARQTLDCPLVAIGGIQPANGAELIAAGADFLAVVHGLFGQAEVTVAAQRYTQLWRSVDNG
ncbi:MAG TPA: thiamine phosphate synthase [Thioploca sp.]|nr:MAG: thiamine phosphate synthase [Gammaproteobacteria bacterium]HDN26070.1 thiamine phosphate synthase [Thioploca sp.]